MAKANVVTVRVGDARSALGTIGKPRRSYFGLVLRSYMLNKGALIGSVLLAGWVVLAVFAPLVAPNDPLVPIGLSRQPPALTHLMGTDLLGRDVLSRVIFGARISLLLGLISVAIGVSIGTFLGLPAAYYPGWLGSTIMRVVDAMMAFPGLLLALVVIASLGPGLFNVMIAVGIGAIPAYARLVRGSCLAVQITDYVQAAKVIGSSDLRVMVRHIVPNLVGPVIVLSTLNIGNAILIGASLSYLGMGAQPPTPEWGLMTADGRAYLATAWWLTTFPGLAIFSVVIAVNLMGDGLRAALDPRGRQR